MGADANMAITVTESATLIATSVPWWRRVLPALSFIARGRLTMAGRRRAPIKAPAWLSRVLVFVACNLGWACLTMLVFRAETTGSSMFMGAGAWAWWAVDERVRERFARSEATDAA